MNASLQNKISAIRGKKSFLRNWELLVELLKIQLNFKQNNSFLIRLWFFLEPFVFAMIFVLMREFLTGADTRHQIDYLGMFAVVIMWQFFTFSFQKSSNSLLKNKSLIKSFDFPLVLLPISAVLTVFLGTFVNLLILFFLEFLIKKIIYVDILSLFSVLAVSTIFMSAFCVLYAVAQYFMKDLSYLVPIINRLTLIAFPLFYGPEKIPVKFQFLYLHIPPIWMIAKTKDIVGDSLTVPSFVTFDVTCISILFLLIVFFFLQFYFESLVKNKV
ncbi:MAG: hypothetical protein A3B68_08285 [Candidatus Melainabacteria bacterium RIFCSPHIGHO2_02_FULL_34_12]|nr:MAG: hypothetical protein A3B68_08285 [Candidatus Melainabacteria bacterium RIFCSPHIGHO2_02_FULL_34_12]